MLTPFDRSPCPSGGTPSASCNAGPLFRALLAVLASGTILTLSLAETNDIAILAQAAAPAVMA